MAPPLPDPIPDPLAALADGELDAAAEEVAERLRTRPELREALAAHGRLRAAAARAIRGGTPAAPEALRRRVAELAGNAASMAVSPGAGASRPSRSGVGWLAWPAAAAALLIAGGLVGHWAFPRVISSPIPPVTPTHIASTPVPAALVRGVTRVHVDCSRFLDHYDGDVLPRRLRDLPVPLGEKLGRGPVPCPDLTEVGYVFVGAGPCPRPLEKTVHLLYRAREGKLDDTLSLFVQPDNGQVSIAPGEVYRAAGADDPHPLAVWRGEGLVYYLVADEEATLDAALRRVRDAVPPAGTEPARVGD